MAAIKPTQQIIDDLFAKSANFKHFVTDKLEDEEDYVDEEEENVEVPEDETPDAKRTRLLTATTTSKRSDLIYSAKTEELEALAEQIGGKRLLKGHWYFGFKDELSVDQMWLMELRFGPPKKPANVKAVLEARIKTENEAGTKEIVNATVAGILAANKNFGQQQSKQGVRGANGRAGRGRGGRGGKAKPNGT